MSQHTSSNLEFSCILLGATQKYWTFMAWGRFLGPKTQRFLHYHFVDCMDFIDAFVFNINYFKILYLRESQN